MHRGELGVSDMGDHHWKEEKGGDWEGGRNVCTLQLGEVLEIGDFIVQTVGL